MLKNMLKEITIVVGISVFIIEYTLCSMVVVSWKSADDPRREAFQNITTMRQHMEEYAKQVALTHINIKDTSILWTAYKSAGNTLQSVEVLAILKKEYETDEKLGVALLESQMSDGDLKNGYDEAIVGDAISLIGSSLEKSFPKVVETLRHDGWSID